MPYAWAFGAWTATGLALHGMSVAAVTRQWSAALVAFASPWALANVLVGQNGFLTAGLVALVLLTLERRPALAGVLLGLLTYKPQFGLLFPLALAVSGRWRAFAWAAVTTLGLLGLSSMVFGPETLTAFLQNLPQTNQALVSNGGVGWGKLQSVYGLARGLGAPLAVGWAVQGLVSAAAALITALVWRGRAPFELKAACLALAAVIATPYVFAYDLPILAVPLAFLWRQRPFDRVEYVLLAMVGLAMVPYLFAPAPSGLVASLAIGAAIGRRVLASRAPAPEGGLAAAVS
jgi:arabinofuranan 3-O-arabinosyltransferase